jgi:hypothetical protein
LGASRARGTADSGCTATAPGGSTGALAQDEAGAAGAVGDGGEPEEDAARSDDDRAIGEERRTRRSAATSLGVGFVGIFREGAVSAFKMLRLIFAGAAAAGAAAADLDLVLLDRATYPLATCNDGSMAGYYLRKGSKTDFLVFQQGG